MKKIYFILVLAIVSCQSEKEKQLFKKNKLISEKSQLIFEKSVKKIKESNYTVNVDSFEVVFNKYKSENPQIGLDFANSLDTYSTKLLQKRKEFELVDSIQKERTRKYFIQRDKKSKKVWENSKYGKLQKKHPGWSDQECRDLINRKIWIGMTYEMLLYLRGKPNSINKSNYGNGIEYQCCWHNYNPSCFYMKADNIIYAYN